MTKPQLTVGQSVWYQDRQGPRIKSKLLEGKITRIGVKYVYVKSDSLSKPVSFDIQTLIECTKYSFKRILYLDPQDFYDQRKRAENLVEIRKRIISGEINHLTLSETEQILNILKKEQILVVRES